MPPSSATCRDPGVTLAEDRSPATEGGCVLASWKQLIDDGRMQDGADDMRRTARKPVVLVGPIDAREPRRHSR